MSANTILIVEDDGILSANMQDVLEGAGYDVINTLPTGEAVLKFVQEQQPELILMDIRLAGELDGIEVAQQLKEVADIPFVYITAYADDNMIQRARETYPHAYLVKPVPDRELIASIEMTLRKHSLEQKLKETETALRQSEEFYRGVVSAVGEGIVIQEACGDIITCNQAAMEMLGLSSEEFFSHTRGSNGEAAFRQNRLGLCCEEHPSMHTLKTGEALENTVMKYKRADGREIWLNISTNPIFKDGNVKPHAVVISFSDITERKRAEDALQENQQFLKYIIDNMFDLVSITDLQSNLKFLSPSHEVLGYELDSLIGRNALEFVHPDDLPKMTSFSDGILANPKREDFQKIEYRYRCADGSYLWFETVGAFVLDEKGMPKEILFSTRDFTERKHAEQKITYYTLELEQLYHQLDKELEKAWQVHQRTLPEALPVIEALSFATHYQPAQKMGGDFYDMIQKENKLIFYLSDVSGHGLDGAMLSIFIKHTIKSFISFTPIAYITPASIIHYLAEQYVQEKYPEELYICIFLAVLDLESMELTYCGAGFQDTPLVQPGNGGKLKLAAEGFFITSLFPDEKLRLSEKIITLSPGTTIFFNTDGLTEQSNGRSYYIDRLPHIFYANAHLQPRLIAQAVVDDFRRFNNGSLQGKDDITFLVLQVEPTPPF